MLTFKRVRELFDYNPETGDLLRIAKIYKNPRLKDIAGWKNGDGALRVDIDGRKYLVHRVIFLWMTGNMPPKVLDHLDLDRSNNKWSNLRPATQSQNLGNQRARSTNRSGLKGVSWNKKQRKYVATITVNYKQRVICTTECRAFAYLSYCVEADIAFGEFARAA